MLSLRQATFDGCTWRVNVFGRQQCGLEEGGTRCGKKFCSREKKHQYASILCLDVEHFGKALVHCESDGGGGNHADEVGSQALVEAAYFHKRVSNAAVFDRET